MDGIIADSSEDKAHLFSELFYNSFNTVQYKIPELIGHVNDNLGYLNLNVEEVYKVMSQLDVSKATGSDGLPLIFCKNCVTTLCYSVTLMFNIFCQGVLCQLNGSRQTLFQFLRRG